MNWWTYNTIQATINAAGSFWLDGELFLKIWAATGWLLFAGVSCVLMLKPMDDSVDGKNISSGN